MSSSEVMVMNEKMLERFHKFHSDNPHVYMEIVTRARQFRRRKPGATIGIALIYNLMRWDNAMSTTGEVYKLTNDFQPYYARLIMSKHEDLEGIFVTKKMFSNG